MLPDLALRKGSLDEVKAWLDDHDVNTANENGVTCLHRAVQWEKVGIVRYLLEQGADVNAKTSYGGTALHLAMANAVSDEIVQALREAGADELAKDEDGLTPAEKRPK